MKIGMGPTLPDHFPEYWPGQYDVFSHYEFLCGIPQALFAITTLKENGLPNVCFHAWSSFAGSKGGYYAMLGGVSKGSHTYQNILRTGEFVVNFFGKDYFDPCLETIVHNGADDDEMAAAGFTAEAASTVSCPRIGEAFLSMECTLEREVPFDACPNLVLLTGLVRHIAMEEAFAQGMDEKYGENGFMFNIDSPKSIVTGEGRPGAVAVMKIIRVNEEG